MTGARETPADVPVDPTFPLSAYERVSRLLRGGILVFLLFAVVGMVAQLLLQPSQTVTSLLAANPTSDYSSLGTFFADLIAGRPDALVLLGIVVLVGVTIGRVVLATVDFYRGGERTLGLVSAVVVGLLVVALFIVAPFVR
jgi:uncharacterized membrane protein